jgi:hypothetical protein
LNSKSYRVFNDRVRVVRRQKFAEFAEKDLSYGENGLVIVNAEGDVIVLTEEFEKQLYHVGKQRFE